MMMENSPNPDFEACFYNGELTLKISVLELLRCVYLLYLHTILIQYCV